jgi:hypothetical protein
MQVSRRQLFRYLAETLPEWGVPRLSWTPRKPISINEDGHLITRERLE